MKTLVNHNAVFYYSAVQYFPRNVGGSFKNRRWHPIINPSILWNKGKIRPRSNFLLDCFLYEVSPTTRRQSSNVFWYFFSLHYSVCMAICCDSIQIDTNFYFLITVFQLVVVIKNQYFPIRKRGKSKSGAFSLLFIAKIAGTEPKLNRQ